jgi:hypothetical protein
VIRSKLGANWLYLSLLTFIILGFQNSSGVGESSRSLSNTETVDEAEITPLDEQQQPLSEKIYPQLGLSGLYGFTTEQYAADPDYYDQRYAASMFEASPISHLSTDENQIKVHLSFLMGYDEQNIHSPEFGDHLILGQPPELLAKYNRMSLQDLGKLTELKVNQGSVSNTSQNVYNFVTQTCF